MRETNFNLRRSSLGLDVYHFHAVSNEGEVLFQRLLDQDEVDNLFKAVNGYQAKEAE